MLHDGARLGDRVGRCTRSRPPAATHGGSDSNAVVDMLEEARGSSSTEARHGRRFCIS